MTIDRILAAREPVLPAWALCGEEPDVLPATSTPEERVRGRRTVTIRPGRWTYWVTFEFVHPDRIGKPRELPSSWSRTILTRRGVRRWIARRNRQYDQQLLEERSTVTMPV